MIYIDFDGVVYNTTKRLEDITQVGRIDVFDLKQYGIDLSIFGSKDFYISDYIIETSVYYIRRLKKLDNVCILTKYCTEQEKQNKTKFIESLNIKHLGIKFVAFDKDKQDYINGCDILIDDQVKNLKLANLSNILFDVTGEFNREWNITNCKNVIIATNWSEIFKHISFVYKIKNN